MSYLREIMQRFQASRSAQHPEDPQAQSRPPTDRHRLEQHLAWYGDRLLACSPAMLRYEWAWLEEHIDALELCSSRPEMVPGAGGGARVQSLLEESLRFRDLLQERMAAGSVDPALHRGTLVSTEHAWELSQPEIRRQWGIDRPEGPTNAPEAPDFPPP
jgi:hypothetical protein